MKLLIFIVLKIIEALIIVFVPYSTGWVLCCLMGEGWPPIIVVWFIGVTVLLLLTVCGVLIVLAATELWKLNWKWADKLKTLLLRERPKSKTSI